MEYRLQPGEASPLPTNFHDHPLVMRALAAMGWISGLLWLHATVRTAPKVRRLPSERWPAALVITAALLALALHLAYVQFNDHGPLESDDLMTL